MTDRRSTGRSPLQPLARHVAARLRRRCGVVLPARLLVAVSGGADSVALLRLLASFAPSRQIDLEIGHFDHALRPGSEEDARFVVDLGAQLGIPVHVERWQEPRRGEEAARRARHEFLQRKAVRQGCSAVALGHQLDDQIETVLLRLSRGTGLRGWMGMAWRRPGRVPLVRPLLDLRHAMLVEYLETLPQPWREDPSNRDLGPARNRVRSIVLPALDAALPPGWAARWGASLDELRATYGWMRSAADGLAASDERARAGVRSCALEPLRRAPEPLLAFFLREWIGTRVPRDLSRRLLQAAADLVRNGQSGQEVHLPGNRRLVLEQGRLSLVEPGRPADPGPSVAGTSAHDLEVRPCAAAEARSEVERLTPAAGESPASLPPASAALVAADLLAPPFSVRTPIPGDRVRLLGAPGTKKLHRILQDRRVPRRLRSLWPVVADVQGIVWIPGIGVAERARITSRTGGALRLRLHRPEPPA